jgi:hypothetical protein
MMDEIPILAGRLRVGRKVGRTLYIQIGEEPSDDDELCGIMDTPELAAIVVAAVNGELRQRVKVIEEDDDPGIDE